MINFRFWRSHLGSRIVALMVATSAVLSLGSAGVQLYLTYERDKQRILESFSVIEDSFLHGLEGALWEYSTSQVDALLDGILRQNDIAYVKLVTPNDQIWEKGDLSEEGLILRDFQLLYRGRSNGSEALGTLTAGLTLSVAKSRLVEQFWALVLSNFVKTLLASLAMLVIFDRFVARHLRKIQKQATRDWLQSDEMVALDRPQGSAPDELDSIVTSLNTGRRHVRATLAELSDRMAEVKTLNTKLSDANREQSEFTYAISHDLKSPTNTVQMLLRRSVTRRMKMWTNFSMTSI